MEIQGVFGWLMALGGIGLWTWEAWKIIKRQQAENEKMKELLKEATAAMRALYQSHEHALRFYRQIVLSLIRESDMAKNNKEGKTYVAHAGKKRFTGEDPLDALKRARNELGNSFNGELRLTGDFTAPRRVKKAK